MDQKSFRAVTLAYNSKGFPKCEKYALSKEKDYFLKFVMILETRMGVV